MNREDFRQYMLCGHGRCFSAKDSELENFKDIVLYGCLNDITYDLQCEGSRGLFMYNLALQYEDYNYFLQPAIEKFLSPKVSDEWHTINHLCDFIELFSEDYDDVSAKNAIEEKYSQLYNLLMSLRWSVRANEVSQCYEYIIIVIMQNSNIERTLKIFEDIGNFFIRRWRVPDDDLKWRFSWFWSCACEKYGEKYLSEKLDVLSHDNTAIRRFSRVMFHKEEEDRPSKRKTLSAEEFIEKEKTNRSDVISLGRAEKSEKIKVAEAVVSEKDLNKKADLLRAFTFFSNPFPLSPEILIDYATSENENLRRSAFDAMTYLKADCLHDFALKKLKRYRKNFPLEFIIILINNFSPDDKDFLLDIIKRFKINRENSSGWHNIVLEIVNNIETLPDEFVYFVYEKSMCSCCRESAVEELIRRNLFTEEIKSECSWDCNNDIRKLVENYDNL
ncbi:MAG: hypothetical protein NC177_13530 [Ruminococcus flavefaciens]|nr:hypothetical protein [Ruminococcus flavefaciens]